MLRILFKQLSSFVRHQPVVLVSVVITLLVMLMSLEQILNRGYERALKEQSATNAALAYALEDSVIRSLQAAGGALQTIALGLIERSPGSNQVMLQRALQRLPQLRNIQIVPASQAPECRSKNIGSELLFLAPKQGRYWGDDLKLEGLRYWPICVPYYLDHQLLGFVIGSVNLTYYKNLFQSVAPGHRDVSMFLFSGEQIIGDNPSILLPQTQQKVMEQAWGEYRDHSDKGAFLDSYRATSFYPLVIILRSYDEGALVNWIHDASIVKFGFTVLAILLLVMVGMYLFFKYKREQVQGSNHLLSMAIRSTANAIFITDPQGKIEWVNEAFTRLTGYSLKQVRGQTPRILNSGVHDQSFFQNLWSTIGQGESWRNELVNRHKDGAFISVDQTVTPILDNKGEVEYFIAVHEDITARKKAEEQVLYMAQHDDLTQLSNRRYFEQRLEECLSSGQVGRIALMFIDLDRFKEINDTLGHDAGDVLLKRTAKKLLQLLPSEALLSRLGGDEFALFIHPVSNDAQVHHVAQGIVTALSAPFEYRNTSFSVTCSIGVALTEVGSVDVSSILRQADLAMYRAKQAGKNTYRLFDESMDESMQRRVAIQRHLEEALSKSTELSLYYQPQVDAITGASVGAEVLVRWLRQGEWISPATFIPIAEESGQIIELGRWIIEQTLAQLSDWRKRGIVVGKLAINISTVQMSNSAVAQDLLNAMSNYGIPCDAISVEFTETTLMVRSAKLLRNLAMLRNAGIAVAIDDFGTGYCSLSYLKELNAQYLKIDRSFVNGIGVNESDEHIVTATLAMAKGLAMKVVAEGVETEREAEYLARFGCDILQGFRYGRPMPAVAFEEWLEAHAAVNYANSDVPIYES